MEVIGQIREASTAAWRIESNTKDGRHLSTPVIRDILQQYFSQVKQLDKQQLGGQFKINQDRNGDSHVLKR